MLNVIGLMPIFGQQSIILPGTSFFEPITLAKRDAALPYATKLTAGNAAATKVEDEWDVHLQSASDVSNRTACLEDDAYAPLQ